MADILVTFAPERNQVLDKVKEEQFQRPATRGGRGGGPGGDRGGDRGRGRGIYHNLEGNP